MLNLECQHCYVKQSDANEYHCRVSKSGACKFKPAKLKKNHIQLGKNSYDTDNQITKQIGGIKNVKRD